MKKYMKYCWILCVFFLLSACNRPQPKTPSAKMKPLKQERKVERRVVPGISLPYPFRYYPDISKTMSVHRAGGYQTGYPENCIESMQYAYDQWSANFECDVRESKDGVLFLMHDETLNRTTDGKGRVEDMKWAEIKQLFLLDNRGKTTSFHPPSLDDVLKWNSKNKSILFLDIKHGVDYKDIIAAIKKHHQEKFCIPIFYNLGQAKAFRRYNKDIVINVPIRGMDEWKRFKQSGLDKDKVVAFTGTRRSAPELHDKLHDNGIIAVFGTLGNIDEQAKARGPVIYQSLFQNGVDLISTDNPALCYEVVSTLQKTMITN